jgi:hypothetical protein
MDELDIVIRQKSGKVTAGIPQLGLYAKADDVHAAITALEQKRAAFLADLNEAGGLDDLEVRHYNVSSAPQQRRSELGQFTLKALIIIGLITGAFILWAALLIPRIERVAENTEAKMQQYTKVGGAQFWAKVEDELERAADPAHDIPPEKKRKLLSQIHVLVERLRPFVPRALFVLPQQFSHAYQLDDGRLDFLRRSRYRYHVRLRRILFEVGTAISQMR